MSSAMFPPIFLKTTPGGAAVEERARREPGLLRRVLLTAKSPGAFRRRGSLLRTLRYKNSRKTRLQLTVFTQHRPAFVTDAPAMSGKRRPAAQKIAKGHAAGAFAQARSSR